MEATDEPTFTQSCKLFNFLVCAVVIGIISVAGLLGNVTSFLVLLKHRTETTAIFLLQCMAVADSVLLVTTIFIYSLPSIYPYTETLLPLHEACDAIKIYVWPVAMITHTVTIWLTVLVTWNRFCACCKPLDSYRNSGVGVVRLQVIGVVLLSILYNMPRFFEHQPIGQRPNISFNMSLLANDTADENATAAPSHVSINLGDNQLYQIIYSNVIYFPVMYIVPLLSLAYLNVRLIRSLRAIKERKQTLTGQKPKEDHITLCVIAIVICFIVCQTPALVNQIFWAILDHDGRLCGRFHFYYTKLSDALVVLNSSCNFVIYCLFGKSFRKIFLDTLCGAWRVRGEERTQTCLNELQMTNGDVQKMSGQTSTTEPI